MSQAYYQPSRHGHLCHDGGEHEWQQIGKRLKCQRCGMRRNAPVCAHEWLYWRSWTSGANQKCSHCGETRKVGAA